MEKEMETPQNGYLATIGMPAFNAHSLYNVFKTGEGKKLGIKDITKVIIRKPVVVAFINGKKYVAKCTEEEFDEEKGLMVCLMKYLGINYHRLQEVLAGAVRVKTEEEKEEGVQVYVVKVKSGADKKYKYVTDTTGKKGEVPMFWTEEKRAKPYAEKARKRYIKKDGDEVIIEKVSAFVDKGEIGWKEC